MSKFFQKLTPKQVTDLQKIVQNILQSSQQQTVCPAYTLNPDDTTQNILHNELHNSNTILTELANMTLSILEQIYTSIQEKEDFLHLNEELNNKLAMLNSQLFETKDELYQVKLENSELLAKYSIVLNQRDIAVDKNQALNFQIQKLRIQWNLWKQRSQSRDLEIEECWKRILTAKQYEKNNEQLTRSITQLQQNNQRLQNELITTHKQLDSVMQQFEQAKQKINKKNQSPVSFNDQKQEDSISLKVCQVNESCLVDEDNVLMPISSNLKLQLQNSQVQNDSELNLNQSRLTRSSKEVEDRETQQNKGIQNSSKQKYGKIVKNIQPKMNLNKICSIDKPIQIYDEDSSDIQHNSLLIQSNANSGLQLDYIKDRVQTLPQKEEPPNFKKQKQSNMSRIKFLINTVGGNKNYNYSKKDRYGMQKLEKSQVDPQKLKNRVLDKKATVLTSFTMMTQPSSVLFSTRVPN